MPSSHLNDPQHWRERAKEARAMAEEMVDPISKQNMLDVAANYEHLAKRAEDRRSGNIPKPRGEA
jgi:cytochrome c553